jgi:hypothetical protein
MLAVFKELQEPVAFSRLALHQLAAVAQQLAQLPQRPGRHEALGDQAVPNQISDPLGILHIGLAPRHVADVPGVPDDQLEMPLENGVDRAPVDARALHPDVRHARFQQPVPQRFEVPHHGAKRPHLLRRLRPGRPDGTPRPPDARPDHKMFDDRLHHRLLSSEGDRDAAGTFTTLLRVLPVPEGDKEWRLYPARAGLPFGVANHRRFVSLSTVARCQVSDKSARAASIFIHNGALQALVGCHENSCVMAHIVGVGDQTLTVFSFIMARRRRCLAAQPLATAFPDARKPCPGRDARASGDPRPRND